MTLPVTLALFVVAIALALFAGWRGSRPPDLLRGPRLMPWRFIMMMSVALAFLFLIHLGTLAGAPVRTR